jgi:hypothetical protein
MVFINQKILLGFLAGIIKNRNSSFTKFFTALNNFSFLPELQGTGLNIIISAKVGYLQS